jgi:hypothetical protein
MIPAADFDWSPGANVNRHICWDSQLGWSIGIPQAIPAARRLLYSLVTAIGITQAH